MRFAGKSAVITGGSEGIGFAIAAGLVEEGARVVLVARREDKLEEAVQKLGPHASYVVGDVASRETAELARRGIRVNCLCPGAIETPAFNAVKQVIPNFEQLTLETSLIKRILPAEELARHALTLLDEKEGGYVTGSIWDVDGGYQLNRFVD
jgi:NAD(P)-dependent dehydrogenase (short-subunit alcohol dehydrogenase family)